MFGSMAIDTPLEGTSAQTSLAALAIIRRTAQTAPKLLTPLALLEAAAAIGGLPDSGGGILSVATSDPLRPEDLRIPGNIKALHASETLLNDVVRSADENLECLLCRSLLARAVAVATAEAAAA